MTQRAQATPAAPNEARAHKPAKKRSTAPREAQGLGFDQSATFLNEADFIAFEAAIAEPGKPNAELREFIERGRRLLIKDDCRAIPHVTLRQHARARPR